MTEPTITLYGAHWCLDCRRSKQLLGEHQIPYRWIDIEEDAGAEQFIIKTQDGKRIISTLVFEDGSFIVEIRLAGLRRRFTHCVRGWRH
jgi:glutaredoxin